MPLIFRLSVADSLILITLLAALQVSSHMSEPKHEIARSRRKRIGPLAVAILVSFAVLTVAVVVSRPERLRPGQVIDQVGEYRFPTGGSKLRITKDDSGNVHVTVRRQATRFGFLPYFYSDTSCVFESERDWFVSVDRYGRLWQYHGHWDPAWGKLRKMPSGGTIPYAPAVSLDGMWFTPSGGIASGGNVVTATGDWAGVPEQFFNRIPDRHNAQWGNVPPIPESAPQCAKKQEAQMARRLRRAS